MLLEFRLRNYRSFAQEAVLSLVAGPDKSLLDENTIGTHVRSVPRAVRTSVVYGANASGKSNLLRALMMMGAIVRDSFALKPEQQYLIQPFRLDPALADEPTMFEATMRKHSSSATIWPVTSGHGRTRRARTPSFCQRLSSLTASS